MVDVLLLTLFGAAADQDDDLQAVLGQVDTQPRPSVDLVFADATEPLDVGQVALFHPADGYAHLGGGNGLQRPEPLREGAVAIVQQEFFDLVAHEPNGNL